MGLNESSSGTPADKSKKEPGEYPWGNSWPPPIGAGNYDHRLGVDNFDYTSPVGSFKANRFGLYDMGGNVGQWCLDRFDGELTHRALRGSSWTFSDPIRLLSSFRGSGSRGDRWKSLGFRVVLADDVPGFEPFQAEAGGLKGKTLAITQSQMGIGNHFVGTIAMTTPTGSCEDRLTITR